jgi:hypothetical protein
MHFLPQLRAQLLFLLLIAAPLSPVLAQEICNNGIDDDNDGLVDCYDPDCNGNAACANAFIGQNAACQYVPGTGGFGMVPKWRTDDSRYEIYSTQTVVSGDWDNDGIVEAFALNHNGLTPPNSGPGNKIYVVNGVNGAVKDSILLPGNASSFQAKGIAIGDLDNDGFGELIVMLNNAQIVCYEHTATQKWISAPLSPALTPALNIADFNQDGNPEVYCSAFVLNGQTGVQIGVGAFPPSGAVGAPIVAGGLVPLGMTVAVDVLPDAFCADCAGLELVAGNKVFSVNIATGQVTVQVTSAPPGFDGFTAIADYDKDGDLDGIISTDAAAPGQTFVFVWDLQTPTIIAVSPTFTSNTFWTISQANVGDFDGDGLVEVGVVTENVFRVLDDHTTGLAVLWSRSTVDTSGFTSSVLFDFQGDGNVEVVYQDEDSLYVFEGATGNTLAAQLCRGGTTANHPVILDVDGDDQAEIVAGCSDNPGVGPRLFGYVTAFGPAGNAWVNARSVWNQGSYWITNVNDDLSIPQVQQNHHVVADSIIINGFNIQSTELQSNGTPTFAAMDAAPTITNVDLTNCGNGPNTIDVTIRVDNLSMDAVIPSQNPVALYNGNPAFPGATIIDTVRIPNIVPTNGNATVTITIPDQGGVFDLYVVANDTGQTVTPIVFPTSGIGECNFSNNTTFQPINCAGPTNNAPVATNDSVSMPQDTSGYNIDVLANDTDPDNDSLVTTNITVQPPNGTASINPNGTINYVPDPGYSGLDSLQYVVCDTASPVACDTAWVIINVINTGSPPVAVNDSVSTVQDTSGIDIDVLANDTDADLPNDSLVTTNITVQPPNGTASINANGTVNYIPDPGFSGLDSLQYVVCDTSLPVQCDTAWVFIDVASIGSPPVAVNDSVSTVQDTSGIDIDVLANDTDADLPNDSLITTNITVQPPNGTASINANGTVNYIPDPGFSGLDSLQYVVCDTSLPVQCDTAWVFIDVASIGSPPVAVNDSVSTVQDTSGIDIDVLANDTDADLPNDSLITTNITVQPPNGTASINANGTVNYIPDPGFSGLDSLQYVVCDTSLPVQCDTAWVIIDVASIGSPPVAVNDSVSTVQDTSGIDIDVLANDTDADLPNDSLITTNITVQRAQRHGFHQCERHCELHSRSRI